MKSESVSEQSNHSPNSPNIYKFSHTKTTKRFTHYLSLNRYINDLNLHFIEHDVEISKDGKEWVLRYYSIDKREM